MTEEAFQKTIQHMIDHKQEWHIGRVMKKFGVPRSTVEQWTSGTAKPLTLVRLQIEKYLTEIYAW